MSVPGVEARAGRFPGPSLIGALHAIQREHGWLPRERLVALRLTSICGLGQVALGPVMSVLRMQREGAVA